MCLMKKLCVMLSVLLFTFSFASNVQARTVFLPSLVFKFVAEEYTVSKIEGNMQCIYTVNAMLSHYDKNCSGGLSSAGCARAAARSIVEYACKSYCSCPRKKPE